MTPLSLTSTGLCMTPPATTCQDTLFLLLAFRRIREDVVVSEPSRCEFSSPGLMPSENMTERLESRPALPGPTTSTSTGTTTIHQQVLQPVHQQVLQQVHQQVLQHVHQQVLQVHQQVLQHVHQQVLQQVHPLN